MAFRDRFVRLPLACDLRSGVVVQFTTPRLAAAVESREIQALGMVMPDTKLRRPYLCVYSDSESCALAPLTTSSTRGRFGRVSIGGGSFLKDPGYLYEGSRAAWFACSPLLRKDAEPVSREALRAVRTAIAEHFPALREALGVAA